MAQSTSWLKSFPYSLRIGTDIAYIPRIVKLLKRRDYRLPERILNLVERSEWADQLRVLKTIKQMEVNQRPASKKPDPQVLSGKRTDRIQRAIEEARTRTMNAIIETEVENELKAELNAGMPVLSKVEDRPKSKSEDESVDSEARTVNDMTNLTDVDPEEMFDMPKEWKIPKKLRPEFDRLAEFLAGRWAAKEAVIKAYAQRKLTLHDVTLIRGISRDGLSAAPIAYVPSSLGTIGDVEIVRVSISHDTFFANAVCVSPEPGWSEFEEKRRIIYAVKRARALAAVSEDVDAVAAEHLEKVARRIFGVEMVWTKETPLSRGLRKWSGAALKEGRREREVRSVGIPAQQEHFEEKSVVQPRSKIRMKFTDGNSWMLPDEFWYKRRKDSQKEAFVQENPYEIRRPVQRLNWKYRSRSDDTFPQTFPSLKEAEIALRRGRTRPFGRTITTAHRSKKLSSDSSRDGREW